MREREWAPTMTFSRTREPGPQREVLKRPRDADASDAVRGNGQQVVAVEGDVARRRFVQTRDHVEQRRLARAVRSDEARDLTLLDRERQPVERNDPAEGDRHSIDAKERHRVSHEGGPPSQRTVADP